MSTARPPSTLLVLFWALVVADGALRKWVLPQYATPVYMIKDGLLLLAFCALLFQNRGRLPHLGIAQHLRLAIAAYVAWVFVETWNPSLPSAGVAVLGFRSHLLYMVLIPLTALAGLNSAGRLRRVLQGFLVLSLLLFALAAFQYSLPPSHWLNSYVADTDAIATVGAEHRPRVTATFSYISGFTTFVMFALSLAVGALIAGLQDRRLLSIGAMLLTVAVMMAPMTGARAPLMLPLVVLPFVVVAGRHALSVPMTRLGGVLLIAVVALGASFVGPFERAWTNLWHRIDTSDDIEYRVEDAVFGAGRRVTWSGAFGYGAGSTHQGAAAFTTVPAYRWRPPVPFEEENGRVALELGPLGLVLYLLVKVGLFAEALRVLRRAEDPTAVAVGVIGVMFLGVHLLTGTVFNSTAGALYWAVAGVVLAERTTQRGGVHPPSWAHGQRA